MQKKEVDLLLKAFKFNVQGYYRCLEKIEIINNKLDFGISSPLILGFDESKYQRGTNMYKNNLLELLDEEDKLIKELNHHKFVMDNVRLIISTLSINELKLIDCYYWYGMTHQEIALKMKVDTSVITKKINKIIQKLHYYAIKISV